MATSAPLTKIVDIVLVGAISSMMLALTGCPDNKDGSDSDPGPASSLGETGNGSSHASTETGAEPSPVPERPEAVPLLCTLDGGKWCKGCEQQNAGALCCAGETCVVWDAASGVACDGAGGWCGNYSTSDKTATCHDAK